MSTITETTKGAVPKKKSSKKILRYNPNRVSHTLDKLGLGYFSPIARLIGGDEPKKQLREIASNIPTNAGLCHIYWSVGNLFTICCIRQHKNT